MPPFRIVWEIESPAAPDLARLAPQFAAARTVTDVVLATDNHLGRATVSSVTVAGEARRAGLEPVACLNTRDRNLLGLRRDLLTCRALGVDRVLAVRGDDPSEGGRASDLRLPAVVGEARAHGLRVGLAAGLRPLPAWKREADELFVQVSFSLDDLLRWRETADVDVPVYPAVLVVASSAMARRLAGISPDLRVPDPWVAAVERDRRAGIELAVGFAERIRDSGAFAGVHLVAGARWRATADRFAGSPVAGAGASAGRPGRLAVAR